MRAKLTVALIEGAKPKQKPYKIFDTQVPELFVRVMPSGVKSFNISVPGRERATKALGKFASVSIEAARAQARELLVHREQLVTPKKRTFKAFIEGDYATHLAANKAGKADLAGLKAQFLSDAKGGIDLGQRALSLISELDVARFKANRLKKGIAKVTINRDLDRLRACLNVAKEYKLLASVPKITHIDVQDSTRVRFLSADEEKRLRAALQKVDKRAAHLRPLVLLAMNTGCRRGELLSLDWQNVDLDGRMLRVTSANSKTGKQRYVPLNDEALKVLKQQKPAASGLVFPSRTGSSITHFKRSFATLMKAAKIEDFHYHDCRHHFATRLAMASVDLFTVGKLLGHSGAEITERYAHLSSEHLAKAVRKLAVVK